MKLRTTLVPFLLLFSLVGCYSSGALVAEGGGKVNQKPIVDRWATDVVEPGIPKENANSMGKWKIDRSVSRMDDSVKITVSLEATNKNSRGKPVSLNFSCTKSKRDIKAFIDFGENVSVFPSNHTKVVIRFDKKKPLFTHWKNYPFNYHIVPFHILATSYMHSPGSPEYLLSIEASISFLKDSNRMLIQITPFMDSERILEFQIRGFSEAIKPLIEACPLTNMFKIPESEIVGDNDSIYVVEGYETDSGVLKPVIPETAIGWVWGLARVFVVDQQTNKTEIRVVRLGEQVGKSKKSVLSGLKIGEKIVVNPPHNMTSGFTITQP